ncbi:MetQ/NlpA family ABC transporter substrate-binding protein [Galbitalea sp. SE-J8]|uniref:MetQ/NlpA family ABC transporter substrate-binding protein n=1 Tax=Galbitalea sp. SE-J8 TaxID=3054952 RepID=UPI00259C9B9A|nr:MetQ/NlpA family ABC transporter substrate-binding protein [Galbitalea sp. SE-J8]MDM4763698.1 MetQ/NlpA family ABC transporter substrate-binding protein [Galbitalea sp. SE-J8]
MPTALSKKIAVAVSATALVLTAAACSSGTPSDTDSTPGAGSTASGKTDITVGFNPGPYEQMFVDGIEPILEKEGYTVNVQDFSDGITVNVAVAQGEIDANIMQHPIYLKFIDEQQGIDNVALVQIPTPNMALFGGKKSSLDDIADGDTVSVPNSPSNLYRALLVLRGAGLIDFDDIDDPNTADTSIITKNPHNLVFTPIDNAQQVPTLQDVDYAVIQGNFIISGGLDYADALAVEKQPVDFSNVVAVRSEDVDSDWAKAISDAYHSQSFIDYINGDPTYTGYNVPEWFH